MRRPIRAIFSDLDGTFLNPSHTVSDYTIRVVQKLQKRGIFFIVATGRPYADVFEVVKAAGIQPDYIITSNGARVHDHQLKEVTAHDIDPALCEELVRIRTQPAEDGTFSASSSEPKRFTTNLYQGSEWVTDKAIKELADAYNPLFQPTEVEAIHTLSATDLRGVHEAFFVGEPEDLQGMFRYMKKQYADRLLCSFSMPFILDAVPIGVSKGVALREVCELLRIDVTETVAFGDGMNDEPMLATAGHAYVMENGQPALKAAIPTAEVIGSNAEDGVAKKLEELFFSATTV